MRATLTHRWKNESTVMNYGVIQGSAIGSILFLKDQISQNIGVVKTGALKTLVGRVARKSMRFYRSSSRYVRSNAHNQVLYLNIIGAGCDLALPEAIVQLQRGCPHPQRAVLATRSAACCAARPFVLPGIGAHRLQKRDESIQILRAVDQFILL